MDGSLDVGNTLEQPLSCIPCSVQESQEKRLRLRAAEFLFLECAVLFCLRSQTHQRKILHLIAKIFYFHFLSEVYNKIKGFVRSKKEQEGKE